MRPQIVGALMHEIECILNEYLSFNWDRLDDVLAANMHLLRADGLACPWKSAPSLEVRGCMRGAAGTTPLFAESQVEISAYCGCVRVTVANDMPNTSPAIQVVAGEAGIAPHWALHS